MRLANIATLPDTSSAAPSLTSHNGRLYLAWSGTGNKQINIEYSTDGGLTFGHKFTSNQTSAFTPALFSLAGKLFIAWTGTDADRHLNVAEVED